MSRSGYSDDCDGWALIRWRGAVTAATRGKRGQQALREILAALDAMPVKELAAGSLVTPEGEFCTLGALGAARGMDMAGIDPDDRGGVAKAFGIAEALAAEIMFENDEGVVDDWKIVHVEICGPMDPYDWRHRQHKRSVRVPNPGAGEQRWRAMRSWVACQLIDTPTTTTTGAP